MHFYPSITCISQQAINSHKTYQTLLWSLHTTFNEEKHRIIIVQSAATNLTDINWCTIKRGWQERHNSWNFSSKQVSVYVVVDWDPRIRVVFRRSILYLVICMYVIYLLSSILKGCSITVLLFQSAQHQADPCLQPRHHHQSPGQRIISSDYHLLHKILIIDQYISPDHNTRWHSRVLSHWRELLPLLLPQCAPRWSNL